MFVVLIVLFPFLGFLFIGLFGSKIKSEKLIGTIGSAAVGDVVSRCGVDFC